jgi:hypothetical protein
MVNKKDVEVFIVCLSSHFDMGKLPYPQAGGTPLAFSMIHVCDMGTKEEVKPNFRTPPG